jgi:hypothetical protein
MLKKALVAAAAAAIVAVPLAGAAWADGVGEGGVPGEIGGSPGTGVSTAAKFAPGLVADGIKLFGSPGNSFRQLTPAGAKP